LARSMQNFARCAPRSIWRMSSGSRKFTMVLDESFRGAENQKLPPRFSLEAADGQHGYEHSFAGFADFRSGVVHLRAAHRVDCDVFALEQRIERDVAIAPSEIDTSAVAFVPSPRAQPESIRISTAARKCVQRVAEIDEMQRAEHCASGSRSPHLGKKRAQMEYAASAVLAIGLASLLAGNRLVRIREKRKA